MNVFSLGCIAALLWFISSSAGDSVYGKVTTVKSPTQMRFEFDSGFFNIRLAGIDVPRTIADSATQFVTRMTLRKNGRIRLEGRVENEVLVRLFMDDSLKGVREVAVEMLRNGFATRKQNVDFKYGELAAAQREAQVARRGLWSKQN
ncbi:MAG TPA: thermonuclease family protein [Chitinophagaceae bacterium]|nr:thermonuclease family protein [Chitinophagaceae bacterium]